MSVLLAHRGGTGARPRARGVAACFPPRTIAPALAPASAALPPRRFDNFHVYACAALLLKFATTLKGLKFAELVTFIQKMPTKDWGVKDVEELLAQAYVYKTLFEAAPSHLST